MPLKLHFLEADVAQVLRALVSVARRSYWHAEYGFEPHPGQPKLDCEKTPNPSVFTARKTIQRIQHKTQTHPP